jgi:hypothetical protein
MLDRRGAATALALILGLPAAAQQLDVPVPIPASDGQTATCASSVVGGLDPNGDGFLAVRSGPGTEFRKIGELNNGDLVYTCDARGDWIGIKYRYPQPGAPAGPGGWVHGNWLTPYAG